MSDVKKAVKLTQEEDVMEIDLLFQEAILKLKEFHDSKMELIKKFREVNNIEELNKIRVALKEQL